MKICFVTRYPPQKDGIAIYAKHYVQALRDLGHEVEIIAFKGHPYSDKKIHAVLEKDSWKSYEKCYELIKAKEYDEVILEHEYVFYNPLYLLLLLRKLKKQGMSTRVVMHTIASYKDLLKKTVFLLWNTSFLLYTDVLYVHTKNALRKIKKSSLAAFETRVIPLPIDPKKKRAGRKKPGKKVRLLAQGFIAEDKGYHLLIDAFSNKEGYEVRIVGTVNESSMGKQKEYFNQIKEKAKEAKNITIVDRFISEQEKQKELAWADFVVLPYLKTEQSAVLTGVWGSQCIPVCSDIVPFKEEIENNKYGVLFESNNSKDLRRKVEQISQNVKKKKEIEGNIRNLIEKRSFRQLAKEFLRTL